MRAWVLAASAVVLGVGIAVTLWLLGDAVLPAAISAVVAVVLGVVANITHDRLAQLLRVIGGRDRAATSFLASLASGVRSAKQLSLKVSVFSFHQVVYDRANLIWAATLATQVSRRIARGGAALSPVESALLLLYCTRVAAADEAVERVLGRSSFHDALEAFARAAENADYRLINLTLSLAELFGDAAAETSEAILRSGDIMATSHWRRVSDAAFIARLQGAHGEHLTVSSVVGQTNQFSMDLIGARPTAFEQVHFMLSSPLCVSHGTLRSLAAEYTAPAVFKEPFHFLESNGAFTLDYLRRVFKILANCSRFAAFAEEHPAVNVRVSFYTRRYPGASLRILRNAGLVQVHTGALDVAKYVSRFAAQVTSPELANAFIKSIDALHAPVVADLQSWSPSREAFESLTSDALRELVVYLIGSGVTATDVRMNMDRIRLVLRESEMLLTRLLDQTFQMYDWLSRGPTTVTDSAAQVTS